jgi:hypothetical protein
MVTMVMPQTRRSSAAATASITSCKARRGALGVDAVQSAEAKVMEFCVGLPDDIALLVTFLDPHAGCDG